MEIPFTIQVKGREKMYLSSAPEFKSKGIETQSDIVFLIFHI